MEAEEARHISFGHEFLRKRVPRMRRLSRFWLSLYVPIVMRVLCQAIVVPPRRFSKEFDIPAVDVAHLQDRRSAVALSQRAAARAPADPGRIRSGISSRATLVPPARLVTRRLGLLACGS